MKKTLIVLVIAGALAMTAYLFYGYFHSRESANSARQPEQAGNQQLDELLIRAYSWLSNVSVPGDWEPMVSNYIIGDVRGMMANIGAAPQPVPDLNQIQNFTETPENGYLDKKWELFFNGISACNEEIIAAKIALSEGMINNYKADLYFRQARALRGWYHFEAWRIWGNIPYIDELSEKNSFRNDLDIRKKIIADLQEGTSLPDNMGAPGRFNGTVCQTLLAKAEMQMFHDYQGALAYLNLAKNGTKSDGGAIGLSSTYGEIFDIGKKNEVEDVFSIQYSVSDGSGGYGSSLSERGNSQGAYPGPDAVCCGFISPTQEFVNSFRTSNGLPLLDGSYNNIPVLSDQGKAPGDPFTPDPGPFDPRIDWSVGRRGIPFWDWGKHMGSGWKPENSFSGPWTNKKQVYRKSSANNGSESGTWTSGYRANGYHMIRYADILLLMAECQIETGDLDGALRNINLVRARAANPAGFVTDGNKPAANYQIGLYKLFPNADYARKALRMERKLELGLEGQRWFDLQRWGITAKELGRILAYEKTMPWGHALYASAFVSPEKMTFPIPQRQIDMTKGRLIQNK